MKSMVWVVEQENWADHELNWPLNSNTKMEQTGPQLMIQPQWEGQNHQKWQHHSGYSVIFVTRFSIYLCNCPDIVGTVLFLLFLILKQGFTNYIHMSLKSLRASTWLLWPVSTCTRPAHRPLTLGSGAQPWPNHLRPGDGITWQTWFRGDPSERFKTFHNTFQKE